jgi:spore coat protein CotH
MLALLIALSCAPVSGSGEISSDDPAAVGDTDGSDSTTEVVLATDTGTDSVTGQGGPPTDSEVLFDEASLPVFELTVSDDALQDLADQPYEWTTASLTHDGRTYGPIGIRTKGENSWRPFAEKSSVKLDFNRYEGGPDRFYGMKGLTFNAMNEDLSMMHERVAYRVYRETGVPAVRAHHAVLYLNGELYGLFVMLDTVDDQFLARNFDDPTGSMWEQHDGDFTDDYVMNNTYFQHEEGEDDRAILQSLADALEGSGDAAVDAADAYIDWGAFHRYWAAGSVVMNFDAYPFRFAGDDCHVYHDPSTGKLVYIPHGVDESFYYDENFEERARGHVAAKCRESAACRDDWARAVYDALEYVETEDIAAYAEQVAAQIDPWVDADPNRNYSRAAVRNYQADMISKMRNRRASVTGFIGPRPE